MTNTTSTDTAVAYFIAVPGDDQASGIFGIGLDYEAAVRDAYDQSNSHEPTVTQIDDGFWTVTVEGKDTSFGRDETEARDYAAQKGFIARECTERLYRHLEAHGCDAGSFRWSQSALGLDDLKIDEEDLAAALAEVKDGLDGTDGSAYDEWKAETALEEAHDLVDFYVWQDEDSGIEAVVKDDREFRTALDLAVRDFILKSIAERDAA